MPIDQPLRLDRLQLGVFGVLSAALPSSTVGWAYGQAAFEGLTPELVNVQMANGPSYWTQKGKRSRVFQPFDSVTLDVTGSTSGVRNIVRVNGIDNAVDGDGLLDPEGIRDALVVLLNADTNDPWTAAPGGAPSELVLTPDSLGTIYSLELAGELAALSQVISSSAARITQGTRVFTITIECFSKDREPRNGAWSLMSTIEGVFEDEDHIETLNSFGVSVWDKGIAADISAIAGANWESRVTLDVQMAMRSALVKAVSTIETVNATINVKGDFGTIIATQTFTVAVP